MSRYFYVGLFAALLVIIVGVLAYRTPTPQVELAASMLPTVKFGGVSLRIEYATTTAARERGLGGRESLPSNYGMLFVFPKDSFYGFWMKDTRVPLDMFWLDAQGHVVSIVRNVATSSYPDVFYPTAPARYVLETAAGFAEVHHIVTGTPLLLKNFPIVSE